MGLTYKGAPGTADSEAWRQLLRDFPFLDGQEVTVSLPASTAPQLFQHFLGRAYRGGLIMSQDFATGLVVCSPAGVADPTRFFALHQTTASAINATVWLF